MRETPLSHTLPNGLTLLSFRKPGAPVVAVEVWYRTGSADDPEGRRGIAHVLEHMMFRGSDRVGPEEHARRVGAVGGHANAFTAEDVTVYVNAVPREHLDMVLDLEADRMLRLRLQPALFEIERNVLLEEYHTCLNNPMLRAMLEFRREFFGSHPYGVGPLGELEQIQQLRVDDCREFYRARYRPSQAFIVVAGDFDSHERLIERVARRFGVATDEAPAVASPEWPAPRQEPRHIERRIEFDVPVQIHGFSVPCAAHRDTVALDVLMQIVAQGESSRLVNSLVRGSGVAIAAGGANQFLRAAGMSMLFAAFTPDTAPGRVEQALRRELDRVCRDGVSEAELEKARNQSLAHHVFDLYCAERLCHCLGQAHGIEGGADCWLERLAQLERIGVEQVVEAARRYWTADRAWVLTLRPRRVAPVLLIAGIARRILRFGRRQQPE